ncbi:50S ribosomal protein L30 [Candidatus Nitrosacidococcus sp. I8]|uniref:50S ribosomal protein L30 n=1 Tax=Candidatus Nitrosacidococcus sp. I8 TaxID=2942908 RepID=UPI002226E6E2|nr:50S ribosomal protein L30 [Candidatus Nitrosacidococcus sp. I8]CAH9017354.1 50S ribosomal protein L30 [Candidatus Nitrosacidococcus sp. I8]
MDNKNKIQVVLVKSLIGRLERHKKCAIGLGLRRIGKPTTVYDTPENRGMIKEISYLIKINDN